MRTPQDFAPLPCPVPGCTADVPGHTDGPPDDFRVVYREGERYACEAGHWLYADSSARGGFYVDDTVTA